MNTINRTKAGAVIYCILGMAAMGFTAAQAADDIPPSKTVKFADLNIHTPEGAKALYQRIRVAAADVCDASIGSDPVVRQAMRSCVDTAIDDAVKKVNAPYLTALRFGENTNVRLASK
jgi:UrcA family protein